MKFIIYIASSILLTTLCSGVFFYFYAHHKFEIPGPLTENKIIYINKGTSFSHIVEKLDALNAIDDPLTFEIMSRIKGLSTKIHAGEFEIPPYSSQKEILNIFIKGKQVQHQLTLAEGLTVKEILKEIENAPLIDSSSVQPIKEGEVLPETYNYTWKENANTLIGRMKEALKKVVKESWETYKGDYLKTPQELLILASIIEKETALESERAHIAGVFANRLKKGMHLQSDPTVIYGLELERGHEIQQLLKKDLSVPTEYNTYLNLGLPPTPICCPGKASIEAASNPMETDDLFFVADGTGGHIFSKTYKEHAENHRKWRKIRAERLKEARINSKE